MSKPLPLFVYGTLRAGGGKECLLGDAVSLGETTVQGVLYDFGTYPALVPGSGSPVYGELRGCTAETLARLDAYEGVTEGLFDRVRLVSAAGPCWVYVAGRRLMDQLARATTLPEGRWTEAGGGSP